jgi:hypothetical protein
MPFLRSFAAALVPAVSLARFAIQREIICGPIPPISSGRPHFEQESIVGECANFAPHAGHLGVAMPDLLLAIDDPEETFPETAHQYPEQDEPNQEQSGNPAPRPERREAVFVIHLLPP